jgi:hypothetical protein
MYLDAAEEKMLRAIVRSAVAEAAAGRPFRGTFRGILITARSSRGDESGIEQIEARIVQGVSTVIKICSEAVLAAGVELDAIRVDPGLPGPQADSEHRTLHRPEPEPICWFVVRGRGI